MEQEGKIIKVMPIKSGIGKTSGKEWKSQEYVMETIGEYPKHICFNVFGDKIEAFGIKEGDSLVISFDIDAREYNDKWYNSITAFRITRSCNAEQQTPFDGNSPVTGAQVYNKSNDYNPTDGNNNDDLPF